MGKNLSQTSLMATDMSAQAATERVRERLRILLRLAVAIGMREGMLGNGPVLDDNRETDVQGGDNVAD